MAGKFVGLFSSKIAVAAMGGLLLAGGVSTVTLAAPGQSATPSALFSSTHAATSHGHGNTQGKNQGNGASKGHKPADHPETVSIHGTLTQYDATHATITVTGKAEDNDDHGKDRHDSDGANGSTTACTLTSPFTITLGANTKFNGQAKGAGDLANDLGHKVEVQAQEGSNCALLATKVTTAATDAASKNRTFVGTVGTVGASSFTLTPRHGSAMTVNVTPATTFGGHLHQLSDLKSGMHVVVHGTLSAGNAVQASRINANANRHMK